MEVSYWPIAAFRKGQLTAKRGHCPPKILGLGDSDYLFGRITPVVGQGHRRTVSSGAFAGAGRRPVWDSQAASM